ncbi:hypothetical protein DF047_30990 [Burkholderia cenocepacia]|uniref:hypothetical protein n=1 Tax=Burkholderia cenocepacia TaxID=95486 RepID=UPI000F5B900D|nr:hypothetical protein [Burkholderia cenocepacia]RQV00997.1 hypothetical protein DF047_30990 [Burkholderia cenocepacia]
MSGTPSQSAAPVTVRDAVIDLSRPFGIDRVFGNPGPTELPMFRDFPADFGFSHFGHFGGKAGIAAFPDLRRITVQTAPRHYPF